MKSKSALKAGLTISLIMLFIVSGIVDTRAAGLTNHTADMTVNVVILSKRTENPQKVSLGLDSRVNYSVFDQSMDTPGAIKTYEPLNYADVVILDSYLPHLVNDTHYLLTKILEKEMGVILFGGHYDHEALNVFEEIMPAYFTINRKAQNGLIDNVFTGPIGLNDTAMDYFQDSVYNTTKEFTILDNQIQVQAIEEGALKDTQFIQSIAWQSCPLLKQRFSTFANKKGANTLVEVPDTKEPLIVVGNVKDFTTINKNIQVIYISTGLDVYKTEDGQDAEMNTAFKLWPYFNYFMYLSVFYCSNSFDNANLETYAQWPYSPIPHEREATIWMTFVAVLWVFNFALFFSLSRKKKADTNVPETRSDSEAETKPEEEPREENVQE